MNLVGTAGSRGPKLSSVESRFWDKVNKSSDPDGCWLWKTPSKNGYGMMSVKVGDRWTARAAHRLSWEFTKGPISDGLTIDHRHTCPKSCVNPSHLRPCTQKQNNENRSGAYKTSASGVRGVFFHSATGRWQASVRHNGKQHYVGYFATIDEADQAVRKKRLELFTHNDMDRV